ncbi:MAG: aminotransferase class V-fold PLP-dependent enzyme [Rhodospirillales bacterium]
MDIDALRAETPRREGLIHLDNAGASLQPTPVMEEVRRHLELEASIGGYRAIEENAAAFDNTYAALARLLNCSAGEIALIENATRAWDMAFYSLASTMGEGDRILTAEAEYASNFMAYLQVARRRGVVVETVPSDADGCLDVAELENLIDGRTKLIAVTHAPTNGGLINPAADIGRVAKAAGVPYLLDACQSVGQTVTDVEALGCDFLSGTGRKYLRGPRGTGFLYVRSEWIERLEPVFLDLHAATWTAPGIYEIRTDAKRFENFEKGFAANIGLGVAVDYALGIGMAAIEQRVASLADRLRAGLSGICGVRVCDIGREKSGICTFVIDVVAPATVREKLWARNINTSLSKSSSTLLDMTARGLDLINRASVHYFNTEDEIDRTVDAVAEIAAGK